MPTDNVPIITPDSLLAHWQGHRRVTRRVIEAFPEDKLFSFSAGSMRPFAELVLEFLKMGEPILQGVAIGKWESSTLTMPKTKEELLALWDVNTKTLNELWATIPPHRFAETDTAFGQWKAPNIDTIFYAIDNEIHHRGQAYVYLRALNIEPPPFYDRS